MTVITRNLFEIDLSDLKFEPSHTFSCGQVFRWKALNSEPQVWTGVVKDCVVQINGKRAAIKSEDASLETQRKVRQYFTPDDDLNNILRGLNCDEFLSHSINEFSGLRLLTQDPWECLISFVCSINKNIPAIQLEIENLCSRFGCQIESDLGTFRAFPSPRALARAGKNELLSCKVGFRWKYIEYIADKVHSGELDLEFLKELDYSQARRLLISKLSGHTAGVGPKVADCVLLFSLRKSEAFPIDIWMLRCIRQHYSNLPGISKNTLFGPLNPKSYSVLSEAMRAHFGKYAGYAQQYLYMKTRSDFLHSR